MMEKSDSLKKAVLVSISESTAELASCESGLAELERLLSTAGGECVAKVIQVKERFDPKTCIGSGKVQEIRDLCRTSEAELVIFDFELSPSQIRNLEDELDAEVIDRSMLILDIFALHAMTAEGKLQVELAQLKYTAPRLIGKGKDLSRQGGGIGTRGPGESRLETDRRHIKERICTLESQLTEVEKNRRTMRAARDRSGMTKVAIVGYTNAGKSTLLNRLTDAGVLAEDKLFATLDATTRKMTLPSGEVILLTDTVGFIRKLPHHLVNAFHSTLEEVTYSDVILIVADASDPDLAEEISVTESLLSDLDAADKPTLYVFNKCDLLTDDITLAALTDHQHRHVMMSAKTGNGTDEFVQTLEELLAESQRTAELLFPWSEQGRMSALYGCAQIIDVRYEDEGIAVVARLDKKAFGQFEAFVR